MGCEISEMMFMGSMTGTGSAKPFSQPAKPLARMPHPQHSTLVITAQVAVVDKSAVAERRIPVMPIRVPPSEDRNSAPM